MSLKTKIIPLVALTLSLVASAEAPQVRTAGTYFERVANGLITCHLKGFDIADQAFYDGMSCSPRANEKALADLEVTVPARIVVLEHKKTAYTDPRYANSEHWLGKIHFDAPNGKHCQFSLRAEFTDNPEESGDASMVVEGPVFCQ